MVHSKNIWKMVILCFLMHLFSGHTVWGFCMSAVLWNSWVNYNGCCLHSNRGGLITGEAVCLASTQCWKSTHTHTHISAGLKSPEVNKQTTIRDSQTHREREGGWGEIIEEQRGKEEKYSFTVREEFFSEVECEAEFEMRPHCSLIK